MQIFATSPSPVDSALALDDKRVNKMILESSQLLSAALHLHGVSKDILPSSPGWEKHSLAKWVAKSESNYTWLLDHFEALNSEFFFRSGKLHSYASHCVDFKTMQDRIPAGPLSGFLNCCAEQFKKPGNIHKTYQEYLAWKWKTQDKFVPKWTKRQKPSWFK